METFVDLIQLMTKQEHVFVPVQSLKFGLSEKYLVGYFTVFFLHQFNYPDGDNYARGLMVHANRSNL